LTAKEGRKIKQRDLTADKEIMSYLRAHGPHTIAQIAHVLDMSYIHVRNRIDTLSLVKALAEDDEGKIMIIGDEGE
jgi:predicted ArsR family transcriptional regulator